MQKALPKSAMLVNTLAMVIKLGLNKRAVEFSEIFGEIPHNIR